MIKMLGKVDKRVIIALSGGVDSMFALDFLRRGGRSVLALYFDHGTYHGSDARKFVSSFCKSNNIPLVIGSLSKEMPSGMSKEAFWREERYQFFDNWNSTDYETIVDFDKSLFFNSKIITCHHLDDVVETWIFSALNGNPNLIPYKRGNFIRPFLLTSKEQILNYANLGNTGLLWLDDPSNNDTSYRRNFIRHILVPSALEVNPGLRKVIKKKVVREYDKVLTAV
jgi:tRNA(Ile)-lysidine synthase